jgi:hypothetical protein
MRSGVEENLRDEKSFRRMRIYTGFRSRWESLWSRPWSLIPARCGRVLSDKRTVGIKRGDDGRWCYHEEASLIRDGD